MEGAMAQKVTVTLEDDLDGGPAEETVRFGFGGAEYEIDLSSKNAAGFRKRLAPFDRTPVDGPPVMRAAVGWSAAIGRRIQLG
jgi:hypothetical protein